MAKAHPIELRERVVAHVEEGHSHRAAARHYRVSVKFVNDMVKLKRETGSLEPKPLGNNRGKGKLAPFKRWFALQVDEQKDITLGELRIDFNEEFGFWVHHESIRQTLRQLGLSHKKRPLSRRSNSAAT